MTIRSAIPLVPPRQTAGPLLAAVLLAFLGSSLSLPAHGEQLFGIEFDKWLHFNTSALLSVSVTQLEHKWGIDDSLHLAPLGLVAGANLAKEWYDTTQPGGNWDWHDVRTGVLGGFFGVALTKLWNTEPSLPIPGLSPVLAGAASLLIPGLGHFYNGTPLKGWAYLGLQLGAAFPLFLVSPTDQSTTYYGAVALVGLFKCLDIFDAALTAGASPAPVSLDMHATPHSCGISVKILL